MSQAGVSSVARDDHEDDKTLSWVAVAALAMVGRHLTTLDANGSARLVVPCTQHEEGVQRGMDPVRDVAGAAETRGKI